MFLKNPILFSYLIIISLIMSFAIDCDSRISCQDDYTCCRNSSGNWGCCPYRNAVCCTKYDTCCRNGLQCTRSGGCTSRLLDLFNIEYNSKEKIENN